MSPGFIDVHNHTDIELLICPTADSLIKQGVTTIIGGNCGSSRFPLTPAMLRDEDKYLSSEYGLKVDWQDLAGFFRRLAEKGQAVNFATLVGQGTIRAAVVGYNNRPPSSEEMNRMKELASQAIQQGAIGISTGLEYAPGSFASTGELIDLMRVLRENQGIYATHMRDEEDEVLKAVDEALKLLNRPESGWKFLILKLASPELADDRRAFRKIESG